ncbi:FtsX-like permease family protein [Pseudoflavitalea sp. G-6-1-2]|uniref:ABC transporter permease n=1 Tax=Pseudoflavitalea sp. G-6-1-2 TaxID=2728841 RepID=UPI001469B3F4|nr:ABC transporter permease [Pseudoflavitalea sp. G-6-1-2]NML21283.1 FtsX-like permease family protein [Pseudoflavitalea sp. G-6-1-2]
MFRSYLITAIRTLRRNKFISFIHIFGLGLSMTVAMMIMIRMQDDFSYDDFHPLQQRIWRITSDYKTQQAPNWKMASTPLPLFSALQQDASNIEDIVSIYPSFKGTVTADGKEFNLNGAYTNPSFFRMFGFVPESGNAGTALSSPNSVVLTKAVAEKYFGYSNAIGKLITLAGKDYTVTAVLRQPPGKTNFLFEAYASISSLNANTVREFSDWFALNAGYTFVLMKKGSNTAALQNQLNSFSDEMNRKQPGSSTAFALQQFSSISPAKEELMNEMGNASSWGKILTECGVALLILLAACFNYTNLTISRSLKRAKEIGVRKIIGAKRKHIFSQCITEAVLLSMCSLVFAWVILSFVIRFAPFNDGYEFIPSSFHYNWSIIGWSVAFALFTGLLAGTSPAWIMSAFAPLQVLKKLSSMRIMGRISLQKTLIVFQYSLSLVLIIFLATFYRQFTYMSSLDPGYRTENVARISLTGTNAIVMKKEVAALSGVSNVSAGTADFGSQFGGMRTKAWMHDASEAINLNYYFTDADFIAAMQIPFVAGRNFSENISDSSEQYIILNQQAVTALGIKNMADAPGQQLRINDSTRLEIAGVVKDCNYESPAKAVQPLAFRYNPRAGTYIYATVEAGQNRANFEKQIAAIWKKSADAGTAPGISWLDTEMKTRFSQSATVSLLAYLAFIAIVVASLGLLGIVIHTVETRRKEISIRKVIGADRAILVRMLSGGFIKLLLIAGLIAMPVGYILGFMFLYNFPQRVDFGLLNVVICFAFLMGVGLLTIIPQTYGAASNDPVDGLRME